MIELIEVNYSRINNTYKRNVDGFIALYWIYNIENAWIMRYMFSASQIYDKTLEITGKVFK